MGKLRLLNVCVLQIVVLSFFACSAGALSWDPTTCHDIEEVQIFYRNYWDMYMGNYVFKPVLKESGFFVQMLQQAIPSCCSNVNLSFIFDQSIQTDIQEQVFVTSSQEKITPTRIFKFFYPEFADKKLRSVYDTQAEFIRLSQSPGHAIMMMKPKERKAVFVGEIFLKSWAIMMFLITLAWVVGILAWMTDHYKNGKQFPNPFYKGMFDGFWWSIVTMTTVGYGDKSPKSNIARVLAVLWIMISTVFLSLFTANATSILAITQAEDDYSITLGKRIGVFNSKHFVESALNLGARTIKFSTTMEIFVALELGQIDRIIFPNYVDYLIFASSPEYAQVKRLYKLTNVKDHPFQIGMVLAHDSGNLTDTDRGFLRCLRSSLPILEKQVRGAIDLSTIEWDVSSVAKKDLKTALNSDNLLTMTYYVLGVMFGLIGLGLAWDGYKYYMKTHRSGQALKGKTHDHPVATNGNPQISVARIDTNLGSLG